MVMLGKAGEPADTALADLRTLLHSEKEWIKVHVSEFLLWERRCVEEVKLEFLEEARKFADVPKYRIGIWRVLAQAAKNERERAQWVGNIVKAYHDPVGEDRLHAVETLAKLRYPIDPDPVQLDRLAHGSVDAFSIFSLWNAAYAGGYGIHRAQQRCVELLERTDLDAVLFSTVSYVLRDLGILEGAAWQRCYRNSLRFRSDTTLYANLLTTLWIVAPGAAQVETAKQNLMEMTNDKSVLPHIFVGFARQGTAHDKDTLVQLFEQARDAGRAGYDADTHGYAAYAVLALHRRLRTGGGDD